MRQIAVLMTCYNRVKTTIECLDRLFRQTLPEGYSFEVFLVDDASPDETGRIVKEKYPQVNVIQGTGKLFWCKGMRLAWDTAAKVREWDAYLWLNDDVMLFPNALGTAIADWQAVGKAAVLVGAMRSSSDGSMSYGVSDGGGRLLIPSGQPQLAAGEMMSGNFVLVPSDVYRTIGPIYDGYSHACGDYDYSQMLKRAGIGKYCVSCFVGVCPKQIQRYVHYRGKNLRERIQVLFDPKGHSLRDTFIYRRRNNGFLRACVSCIHVAICALLGKDSKVAGV